MQHFLLKSEPHEYSIDALAAEAGGAGMWDGVRNYQARNVLRGLRAGDQGFFYHSSCKVVRGPMCVSMLQRHFCHGGLVGVKVCSTTPAAKWCAAPCAWVCYKGTFVMEG